MESGTSTALAAMIVDDQRPLAEALAQRLAFDGYETVVAITATEALAFSNDRRYDVVFMDLQLPDMSGIAAAAEMKRKYPDQLVVLMTGYASSMSDSELKVAQVDAVLPKPWRPSELEAILRSVERGRR